ncbi:hypothetical protein ACFL6P_03725 [Candidatus Latescibacterota bacterium]
MKKMKCMVLCILGFVLISYVITFDTIPTNVFAQNQSGEEDFFFSSLHHTGSGREYWYSSKNNGSEKITGVPYNKIELCNRCHLNSCDHCHKAEADGKLAYSTNHAKNQELCLSCHTRVNTNIIVNLDLNEPDVHFAKGMKCFNCHKGEDIHGDGTVNNTMFDKGVIDTKCEDCHKKINKSISHSIHGEKLDCAVCHTRRVVTCYNCHLEALINNNEISIYNEKITDWVFLINRGEKISIGTFQSTDYKGKTHVAIAPNYSHSIMKEGRECNQCHGTEIVSEMNKGKIDLISYENGEFIPLKGVIPFIEDKFNYLFVEQKNEEWVPMENLSPPIIQITPYAQPLSQEQFNKLLEKR